MQGRVGSIPCGDTKILHAAQRSQKENWQDFLKDLIWHLKELEFSKDRNPEPLKDKVAIYRFGFKEKHLQPGKFRCFKSVKSEMPIGQMQVIK